MSDFYEAVSEPAKLLIRTIEEMKLPGISFGNAKGEPKTKVSEILEEHVRFTILKKRVKLFEPATWFQPKRLLCKITIRANMASYVLYGRDVFEFENELTRAINIVIGEGKIAKSYVSWEEDSK